MSHTPGPWSQGVTLATPLTEKWSREQIAANNLIEAKIVFANFSTRDEGRGRLLVAQCQSVGDARLIAAAPMMLETLKLIKKGLDSKEITAMPLIEMLEGRPQVRAVSTFVNTAIRAATEA